MSNLHAKRDKNDRILPNKVLVKYMYKYMKKYIPQYIIAILLMVVNVGCTLLTPYLSGLILAKLGEEVIVYRDILLIGLFFFISAVMIRITLYLLTMTLHYTSHKIILRLREDVFSHIQELSHAQLNSIPVGTLVTRATSDVNVLFNMYTNVLVNILKSVVMLILVFVTMFILNAYLSLILLIIVPILIGVSYVFRKYLRKVHRSVRNDVASMNAFLSENISGIKVTQIFNAEDKKYNEFINNNKSLQKSLVKQVFLFGIFRPFVYVMYISAVILVIWFGGKQAIESFSLAEPLMTYDLLYTFYLYVSDFFNPIQTLADQMNELQSAFAAAEKIFYILSIDPDIVDSEDAIDIEITGDIEFKNVWFSYIDDQWVLKDVSFHIHKDDTVAFVGATGSGKTTVLSLICRNYDIQKGQILIDGVDIKKIKLSSLRSQIAQMLQDVFLFSGTILSNITFDDQNISYEEAKYAADYVNASKFIQKLPNQMNEIVRERGNNFSLGQRQLISFARTIAHKPKVLILDEATANIDTETEVLIQDSLEKIMRDGTVICVAHRLSTIQHADRIYVFSNGKIIEQGTHQELLNKKGRYYKLYLLQFEKDNYKNK